MHSTCQFNPTLAKNLFVIPTLGGIYSFNALALDPSLPKCRDTCVQDDKHHYYPNLVGLKTYEVLR